MVRALVGLHKHNRTRLSGYECRKLSAAQFCTRNRGSNRHKKGVIKWGKVGSMARLCLCSPVCMPKDKHQIMPTVTSPLHCPRDHEQLVAHTHHGHAWYSCAQCKGVFAPIAAHLQLASLAEELTERAAHWPRSSTGCPQCHAAMHLTHHEGVEIDVCRHCQAVWLDKGEIERIESRQIVKDEAAAEGIAQGQEAIRGKDGLGHGLSDALDWLGDAVGGLLSS